MKVAQKSDWKIKPLPKKRETISLGLHFSSGEMQKIRQGFIPMVMEEKWFIYFSENVLYLHRSWTGFCIYEAHFREETVGFTLTHADVNRNPNQYTEIDITNDRENFLHVVNTFLFCKTNDLDCAKGVRNNPPDCVRIIPAQRFCGLPTLKHRPYAFYADAKSLEGQAIVECYRLVTGLSLTRHDNSWPIKYRSPFLWDLVEDVLDTPLLKPTTVQRNIRFEIPSEEELSNNDFVVIKVPGETARWALDAFPATWRALAFILSDAKRMGGHSLSWDIPPADYMSARLHVFFCELLAKRDIDRLALMKSKVELALCDFTKLTKPNEETDYYHYVSLDSGFTNELVEHFGISSRCWHGCGYIGGLGEPLCRLFFLRNRMHEDMNVSVMKGYEAFSV